MYRVVGSTLFSLQHASRLGQSLVRLGTEAAMKNIIMETRLLLFLPNVSQGVGLWAMRSRFSGMLGKLCLIFSAPSTF